MKSKLLLISSILTFFSISAFAVPTRYVWMPNELVQSQNSLRVDMEQRLAHNKENDKSPSSSFATSLGFMYGVLKNENLKWEVGADWQEPSGDELSDVFQLHTKLVIPEIQNYNLDIITGIQNFGLDSEDSAWNIMYLLGSMDLAEMGRFSFGVYTGNAELLKNSDNEEDNTGIMLGWNKAIQSGKGRFSAEFISGKNLFAGLNLGVDLLVQEGLRTGLAYQLSSDSDFRNYILAKISFDY